MVSASGGAGLAGGDRRAGADCRPSSRHQLAWASGLQATGRLSAGASQSSESGNQRAGVVAPPAAIAKPERVPLMQGASRPGGVDAQIVTLVPRVMTRGAEKGSVQEPAPRAPWRGVQ